MGHGLILRFASLQATQLTSEVNWSTGAADDAVDPRGGGDIMVGGQLIREVVIDWSRVDERSYLRGISAISGVERIGFGHSVTFFVGENGSGKSTLLEAIAIACGFNPEGGTRNYSFSTRPVTVVFFIVGSS